MIRLCPKNNYPAKIDLIEFKKAALVEMCQPSQPGLDAMILFQRGKAFDVIQIVSLSIFNLLDEEKCNHFFMELKDILIQDPPLLCKPRGSNCTYSDITLMPQSNRGS